MPTPIETQNLSIEEISSEKIIAFYHLWNAKRYNGLPRRQDFSIQDLAPWFNTTVVVDVLDGGADFRYRLIGTIVTDIVGRDLTGQLVSENRFGAGTDTTLARFREAVNQRAPVFRDGRVYWEAFSRWQDLELIVAPLAADRRKVDKLFLVIDYLGFEF